MVVSTYEIDNSTSSYIDYNAHYTSQNAYIDRQITVNCQKRGIDYENSFKTIREIIQDTGFVY